jgi:uncharacterized membrane protein
MITKAFDESKDCFIVGDSWDLKVHIREALNVVAKRLILVIMNPFKFVFVVGLLISAKKLSMKAWRSSSQVSNWSSSKPRSH